MSWTIEALCAGTAVPFRGEEQSAIAKQPLPGTLHISSAGLPTDQQADPVHHGGPDMALHHYPLDHHDWWRGQIGANPLLDTPGAFGSNIATSGLTEAEVLLGDRFRLGSALIEACQPRQPCWKIEHRFGEKAMVKRIMASGRCGWFYRVIEEGEAQAGDSLVREGRGNADWSMLRLFEAIWGTSTPQDETVLKEITELPILAPKLQAKLRTKLGIE